METNYYPYQKGPDGYFHLGQNTLASVRLNCLRTGTLYEDPEFPPSQFAIFGGGSSDIRWKSEVFWKRPIELTQYPQFIADGVSRFDVIQGELGNCWLIAAVANLTMHPGLFSQVVPFDNMSFRPGEYCGAFHFRFWQYGHWIDVVIDDRLPCSRRGELLFLHSSDKREFWSALLEKAYAKLHGSYASLAGGTPSEALQDFSGGIIEAIEIDPRTTNLFSVMKKAYSRSSLMSCSLSGRGGRYEERTSVGLVKGHAYSVTYVDLVQHTSGGAPLIRIRNPWGDFEWKGPWSDGSREWTLVHAHTRSQLNVANANDGEFWMHVDDFQRHFTRLEICHLSPDPIDSGIKQYGRPWNKEMIYGAWIPGVSAGGCLNHSTFAQNPQYFFHFEASDEDGDADKCTVIIGLLQKRPKRATTNALTRNAECIGFRLYKVNAFYKPGEKLDISFFKRPGIPTYTSGDFIDSREVSARFELPTGNYCLVPSTFDPGVQGEFLLRLFAEPCNKPLPQQYTVQQYASQHGGVIDGFTGTIPAPPKNYPTPPPAIINFPNPYASQPTVSAQSSTPYPSAPSGIPAYPPPLPSQASAAPPAYPLPGMPTYQIPNYSPGTSPCPAYPSPIAPSYPCYASPPGPAPVQQAPGNIGFVFGQHSR